MFGMIVNNFVGDHRLYFCVAQEAKNGDFDWDKTMNIQIVPGLFCQFGRHRCPVGRRIGIGLGFCDFLFTSNI